MRRIVLDTNCLLMSIPRISPYRMVWDSFLSSHFILCVSNEILEEYAEILSLKTTPAIARNVIATILNQLNTELITPYYHFELIQNDKDDNKFVDCAIVAGAEYLISNDTHLKVLEQIDFPKVNLLRLEVFCRMLKGYSQTENSSSLLNESEIEYKRSSKY